ncbi:hypothetical protein [Sorangium cellulosum]|uniref:Secreted protein n=1 Tax=Sorangium cellulosum TaxID=56 RepID=A0A150QXS4_SORCE|nr:hypothetical protein [Sorangium cellulosum]KYF72486.1 hypothetical protein BE15_17135 [Sorangium cellulosum]
MRPEGSSLLVLVVACAFLACACSEAAQPAAGPRTAGDAIAQPAPPRVRTYPAADLERMARIAAARCKKANTPSDAACLVDHASTFLRYPPEDPDCRYVAGTALSVAECSEFEEGCLSVDPGDLVRQLDALQGVGKDCQRDPTDVERAAVLKLAGAK